jgi:hypothetical protein
MNASMQEAMQQAQLLRIQYEKEYRTTVMGDAQYCKRELLSRVGGDGFLSVGDRGKSYAIDGLVTGRDP